MGHGGQLICFSCGYSLDVLFGIGMMQCGVFEAPKEMDAGAFTRGLRRSIPNRTEYRLVRDLLLQKHGIALASGYGLYRCSKCGRFHNRFHYQIKHDEGVHEPVYECKKCSVKLTHLGDEKQTEEGPNKIDVSQFPCPKCGKQELTLGGGMMWD